MCSERQSIGLQNVYDRITGVKGHSLNYVIFDFPELTFISGNMQNITLSNGFCFIKMVSNVQKRCSF